MHAKQEYIPSIKTQHSASLYANLGTDEASVIMRFKFYFGLIFNLFGRSI